MKKVVVIVLASLLMFSSSFAFGGKKHKDCDFSWGGYSMDHINIDMDDGAIIISHRDHRNPTVEITEEYELYIDGKLVKTDADQKKLIAQYYNLFELIIDRVGDIGIAGARIGVEGARLGLSAIPRLLKTLQSNYDMEDFEYEMELQAEALEEKAELLEEQAEELEDMADELEDLFEQMENEIVEIGELEWN